MIVYLEETEIKQILTNALVEKLQYSISTPNLDDTFFVIKASGKDINYDELQFGFQG